MRIAYLNCFAGISGDMFLGALLHAGVPLAVMQDAVAALGIGAGLRVETVDRSGISAVKVHVHDATGVVGAKRSSHEHPHRELSAEIPASSEEHRSLRQIITILENAALHKEVAAVAISIFEALGSAEAKVHNSPIETIHFHEVGAVDAIVDIVAASAGIHHLAIDAWYASPLNVGGGMVNCAHGFYPVPAPATAELLRGFPTYSAHLNKELITPTGAALLRKLRPSFGPQPAMSVENVGYGAGTRNPEGFPNVLRLSCGVSVQTEDTMPDPTSSGVKIDSTGGSSDTVVVLETALDDLSPQTLSYAAEAALAAGALDVMLTPVLMKKGRPGTLLTVLCDDTRSEALQALLFRETSTLGMRVRREKRVLADRRHITVVTEFGEVRIKIGQVLGEDRNIAAEFEDCRAAALLHGVPLKLVQQAALFAYRMQA